MKVSTARHASRRAFAVLSGRTIPASSVLRPARAAATSASHVSSLASVPCFTVGGSSSSSNRTAFGSQRRTIYVIAEETPNPESLMFYPQDHDVLGTAAKTKTFTDKASAQGTSLLATALFKVHGVASVMLGARHVTVTKQTDIDWTLVQPNIELVMSQFFAAGLEPMQKDLIERFGDGERRMRDARADGIEESESTGAASPEEFERELLELLEERVQPFVQQDGGDVEYVKTEDNVVYLKMMGACSGCPKSGITLNIQIKELVQHYFPHIVDVREWVDPNEDVIPRGH
ncbi:unnamed protein product [Amoebophrya sp. A25]|nr:unnamed protein product [Amoebophrya sp. A25]|eukprot:GSA25T00024490001.1